MTNCTANVPRKSLVAFSVAGSTTLSKLVTFRNFGLRSVTSYAKDDGSNGTLWSNTQDYQIDKTVVNGPIDLVPRPNDLRWLLPLITGGTFSTNDIKPAPSCPFFRVGRNDTILSKQFVYQDCVVGNATLSSNDGTNGLLALSMNIEAAQMARSSNSGWPSGMSLSTQQPFVHRQSVLTLNSVARRIKDVSVTFDNQLMTDEFYNSRYRTDFPQDGQLITLTHTSPFDTADEEALLDLTAGVSATLVYTSGGMSLTFTFPCLRAIPAEPGVGARGSRVTNQITWEACVDSAGTPSDAPLLITLDDTP